MWWTDWFPVLSLISRIVITLYQEHGFSYFIEKHKHVGSDFCSDFTKYHHLSLPSAINNSPSAMQHSRFPAKSDMAASDAEDAVNGLTNFSC